MKKIFISLLTLVSSLQFVLAQPTKAEIDKMMKQGQDLMKKYVTDTSATKIIKGLQDQQKQAIAAMKNTTANNKTVANGSLYADPSEYGNVDNWKFPAKNVALLSSLPKRVFTKPELVSFLNAVYLLLSKKLPAGIPSSVQSIAAKYNNDADKMGDAAVTGWYTNYREEAVLLILKAAATNPDNGTLLNNCAAILNMGGIEQTAIPILKYLLQSYPNNSMVLNNLGQAYAGLGETDTAMIYLGRSIKAEPENPEANNTAGQIEAAKGNIEKAISYFEQSLKGAFTPTAELKLRKIKKGSSIVPFIKPNVKLPDYFNLFKYKFPAQCTSLDNATIAEAEYEAFRKTVSNQQVNYLRQTNILNIKVTQNLPPPRIVGKNEFIAQPFYDLCCIMARDVLENYNDDDGVDYKKYKTDIDAIEKEYQLKYQAIWKDYADREDAASKAGCCGEGNTSCCIPQGEKCKALDALGNQYLPKFAMINEDFQEKTMIVCKRHFDEVIYWSYLAYHPLGDDYFRAHSFYPEIIRYLGMLMLASNTRIIKSCRQPEETTTTTADSTEIKEPECPFDIEVPFIIGSFAINCDKISLSGGEGALFSYEKNFKSKQSTLSVGIGAKIWGVKESFGPIKGSAGAGLSESLFITFDGNNKIADAGLKFSATVSGGLEAEAEARFVKATKDIVKDGKGIGYTVGINSGWNFDEGPFKGMIGPAPEVQQNKNVNMYKPNN